jgi:2-oxo-4-hydroxy-4-carboxy--5-ureidoimidazoline (OHCU) decarboxylase
MRAKELTLAEYTRFGRDLARALGKSAEKIDLVPLLHASPLLLYQAAVRGKLLYGTHRDFQRLQLRALKMWQDHQKFFQLTERYVKQQTAQGAR